MRKQARDAHAAAAAAAAGRPIPPSSSGTPPPLPAVTDVVYVPKAVCILSHWPFLDAFRQYLTTLYRVSLTPTPVCIERYVCNLMHEVPVPPQGKIEVRCPSDLPCVCIALFFTAVTTSYRLGHVCSVKREHCESSGTISSGPFHHRVATTTRQ
jgi:hypothetical protein